MLLFKYVIFTLFTFSLVTHAQIKRANCVDYDNKRVRCLAKKRCKWKQGIGKGKGFCIYREIGLNAAEIQVHQQGQKVKMKCYDERQNYIALKKSLERATIYQDILAAKNLKEEIRLKEMDIKKVLGCKLPISEEEQRKQQESEMMARKQKAMAESNTLMPVATNDDDDDEEDEDEEEKEEPEEDDEEDEDE
jgi:hypothetical protein